MTEIKGPKLEPESGHIKRVVLIFHGYGADGRDLIDIARIWKEEIPDTLFIAPDAPIVCDENPFGKQWFSMRDWTVELITSRLQDCAGSVSNYINKTAEKYGVNPATDLVLAGFSQGAMVALYQAIYGVKSCAGAISFSGGFFKNDQLEVLNKPPVLLVHGEFDQVVPPEASQMGYEDLQSLGVNPSLLIERGIPHSIGPQGLKAAELFLKDVYNIKD